MDWQHLTCLSHFSAPDVRAWVRRVVELIEMTDVAYWSEHHQLLMELIILSQRCSDSNRNVHLSVSGCNCERLRSRWSQMASECVGRPTSCCCRICGELLTFRLGLHQSLAVLCPLVLKRLLGHLDWFSHLRFRVAIVLAAACIDCTAVPGDLHVWALVITPVEHMQHVLFRLGHRSQVFQLVGQIASITPDALLTETFAPEPEASCNSLSATAARS